MLGSRRRQLARKGATAQALGWYQPDRAVRVMPNKAAWYDVSDLSSMLNNAGAVPSSGDGIKLLSDKSGNSGVNVLCLDGVAGNYASAPDSVPLSITGDIDIRVRVAMNDWTPAATTVFLAKDAAAQVSYSFYLSTTGFLNFTYTSDGSTARNAASSAATGLTDLSVKWVRTTYATATGKVNFYLSDDGSSWTLLGVEQTVTSGSIFDGTSALAIGSSTGGASNRLAGVVYRAQIYNGIAGTLAFDANFATASKLATSFSESSSNAATVTINTSGATGARICGARDLYQGTAANQPIYLPHSGTNYGYLNGVSGNNFSAPDSAALNTFSNGAIDLRFYHPGGGNWDWTPAATQELVVKWDGGASKKGYMLRLSAAGRLVFLVSGNGTTETGNTTASAGVTLTDNSAGWVRVTYVFSTGVANYYESTDGTNWTAVGVAQTSASPTTPFVSNTPLYIGNREGSVMTGYIGRAQIYNGIAGTLAFDFNPAAYTSGTTFLDSSSNAATITINGGAAIVTRNSLYFDGSNDYLKAAAFSLSQPETVYFVGSQVSWTLNDALYDGNTVNTMVCYQQTTTPALGLFAGGAANNNTGLAVATNGVITSVFSGASSALRINRTAAVTGNPGTSAANGFILGAAATPGQYGNITASEVLVRSVADGTPDQNRFALYAGRKWRIAV